MSKDQEFEIKEEEAALPQDGSDVNEQQDELNSLKEQLAQKEAEAKETFEKMQRLAAEYDNFRKRTQKEKEKIYDDSVADVVTKFLPVADNLERALKAVEAEENSALKEGVTLVFRQLTEVFEKLNVKPIEAVGAAFDPLIHNAVMHIEDDTLDKNIVVEEFQKGYIYKDAIVLRHSMVKVAN